MLSRELEEISFRAMSWIPSFPVFLLHHRETVPFDIVERQITKELVVASLIHRIITICSSEPIRWIFVNGLANPPQWGFIVVSNLAFAIQEPCGGI
jgi:hypothetical protein